MRANDVKRITNSFTESGGNVVKINITQARVAWIIGLSETVCVVFAALLPANKADIAAIILLVRGSFESLRSYIANNPFPEV